MGSHRPTLSISRPRLKRFVHPFRRTPSICTFGHSWSSTETLGQRSRPFSQYLVDLQAISLVPSLLLSLSMGTRRLTLRMALPIVSMPALIALVVSLSGSASLLAQTHATSPV